MAATANLQWSQSGKTEGANNQDSAVQVWDCVGYTDEAAAKALFPIGAQYVDNALPDTTPSLGGSLMRLRSRAVKTVGVKHWVITCSFDVPPTGGHKRQADGENPLDKPTVWDWKPIFESKSFDRDLDGNPILNSAYDALATAPQKPLTLWQLNLTKNFQSFNLSSFAPYIQAVNDSDIIYTQPDGQQLTIYWGNMLCEFVAPAAPYSDEMTYVPVTASFKIYMPETMNDLTIKYHQLTFIDQGTTAFYGSTIPNAKRGHICTKEGDVISRDALLDGSGAPLDTNLQVKDGATQQNALGGFDTPTGATVLQVSGLSGFYPEVYYMRYERWAREKNLLPLLALMGVA